MLGGRRARCWVVVSQRRPERVEDREGFGLLHRWLQVESQLAWVMQGEGGLWEATAVQRVRWWEDQWALVAGKTGLGRGRCWGQAGEHAAEDSLGLQGLGDRDAEQAVSSLLHS